MTLIQSGKNNEGDDYKNHPIKRISLVTLLGQEASSMVLNEHKDQLSKFKETGVVDLGSLPFCSESQGVFMDFVSGLSVSSSGHKVWAGQIQKKIKNKYISSLLMYDFKKKSHFLYEYEHKDLILSVLVSETFKLAMSGGFDKTLVLHDLKSGKTVKRFDMKYGYLFCLFDLSTAVAVGDFNTVRILDLETREMLQSEVKAGGEYINCMNLSTRGSDQNNNMCLLVGGEMSNKIEKISIPETITRVGRDILEMRNQTKNAEKFTKKMIFLENENKRLREENQRFKDQLDKEENGKVFFIIQYQKKIMDLSNLVKSQNAINTRLKDDLNLIKNQLTTLKSPITGTNAVKRNLIIQQILQKTRELNPKHSQNFSSEESDDFFPMNNKQSSEKIFTLQKKIREQRDKIYDLENENDALHDKQDHNQRLLKINEKLSQRVKALKKTNKEVRVFW